MCNAMFKVLLCVIKRYGIAMCNKNVQDIATCNKMCKVLLCVINV